MKLLLDDMTGRTHGLNANEACVFAAILKCTKNGRGWFANYRDLAAALPFVISHMTVQRAVQKLLTLGLIERRENALFALSQNVTTLEQNVTDLEQNVTKNDSPLNPLIINNNMEREKDATCTHACDTRRNPSPSFEDFLSAFGKAYTPWTELAAREKWNITSDIKKRKLLEAMRSGQWERPRPDWCIMDFPEPKPEILSFDDYYKRFETTEEQGGWRREFRADEQRTVYIKEP